MSFEPGQTVGEYEILSMLGAGGMGRVYRVRNVISDRIEAMKVLLPDYAAEPDLAARFIAEIRTLASLDHPNIAQLHTAFQVDNQLIMMMEFVEGFTLEQRAKQGSIPQADVIEYTLQILSALSYAHGRGVVHRDIKPANAMVTSHGIVKLMDFGIAKSRTDTQLTRPGTTLGSLYYMSPEQVRGATVDARSDLYSVGILLYELLAGRRPFEADTTYSILNQQLNSLPTPPIDVNPLLPKSLNDLILFALAKDPAQRFQSAEAFRNALNSTIGKGPSLNAAPSPAFAPTAATGVPPASAGSAFSGPAASPAASPAFSPVAVPASAPPPISAAAPPPGPQRAVWITIGALTVVAILVGAAIGLPHFFKTGAASKAPAPAGQTVSAPASTSAPAPVTVATATPAQSPVPAPQPGVAQPAPQPGPHPRHTSDATPTSQPVNNTAQPAPAPQPTAPGPSEQEVEQARDRDVQLRARAGAVSSSLDNLRRQQEADGFTMRQDIASASTRMQAYLQAVEQDFNNGNIAAAQHDMDKADKEISTLEAFFNR